MNEIDVYQGNETAIETYETTSQMAAKLADMRAKLNLVQRFFKEIMVENQDYGKIPGTDKPTLLKPGAEKLNEFYGYALQIKEIQEEKDIQTGFYRARIITQLIHRRSDTVVAEGVGEANTMEDRYRYRWVPEFKLPKGFSTAGLVAEERQAKNGKTFLMYRIENDSPWTLWNTVLKMAKKRAVVDATLSATRSSGIFTQDIEDLQDWINAEVINDEPTSKINNGNGEKASEAQIKTIFAVAKSKGIDNDYIKGLLKERYGLESTKDLTKAQASEIIDELKATGA